MAQAPAPWSLSYRRWQVLTDLAGLRTGVCGTCAWLLQPGFGAVGTLPFLTDPCLLQNAV